MCWSWPPLEHPPPSSSNCSYQVPDNMLLVHLSLPVFCLNSTKFLLICCHSYRPTFKTPKVLETLAYTKIEQGEWSEDESIAVEWDDVIKEKICRILDSLEKSTLPSEGMFSWRNSPFVEALINGQIFELRVLTVSWKWRSLYFGRPPYLFKFQPLHLRRMCGFVSTFNPYIT